MNLFLPENETSLVVSIQISEAHLVGRTPLLLSLHAEYSCESLLISHFSSVQRKSLVFASRQESEFVRVAQRALRDETGKFGESSYN